MSRQYSAYKGWGAGNYGKTEHAQLYGKSQGNKTRVNPAGIPGLASMMRELVESGQMSVEEYMQRLKPKPKMIGGVHPSQFVSPLARYQATTTPPVFSMNIPGFSLDPYYDYFGPKAGVRGSRATWQQAINQARQTGNLGRGKYGTASLHGL